MIVGSDWSRLNHVVPLGVEQPAWVNDLRHDMALDRGHISQGEAHGVVGVADDAHVIRGYLHLPAGGERVAYGNRLNYRRFLPILASLACHGSPSRTCKEVEGISFRFNQRVRQRSVSKKDKDKVNATADSHQSSCLGRKKLSTNTRKATAGGAAISAQNIHSISVTAFQYRLGVVSFPDLNRVVNTAAPVSSPRCGGTDGRSLTQHGDRPPFPRLPGDSGTRNFQISELAATRGTRALGELPAAVLGHRPQEKPWSIECWGSDQSPAGGLRECLERKERQRVPSVKAARLRLADKLRIGVGSFENLVRGRVKKIDASIRDRLQALLVRELEGEIQRLTHELEIARLCGSHLASDEVGAIESHLAAARALLSEGPS